MFISVLGIVATPFASVEYLSRRAEKELLSLPSETVELGTRFDRIRLALPVGIVSSILLATYIATLSHSLPYLPEKVAIHFDASDNPDSYIPRDSAVLALSFPAKIVGGLTGFMVYTSLKSPEVFYRPRIPWSTMKRIANTVAALLCLVSLAITLAHNRYPLLQPVWTPHSTATNLSTILARSLMVLVAQ